MRGPVELLRKAKIIDGSLVSDLWSNVTSKHGNVSNKLLGDHKAIASDKPIGLLGIIFKDLDRKTLSYDKYCFLWKHLLFLKFCTLSSLLSS